LVEKVCIQLRKCYVLNFIVVEGRDRAGGLRGKRGKWLGQIKDKMGDTKLI
jgi:hypothetical protein